jgi:predicted secreted protein
MAWLPTGYEVPKGSNQFMKLEKGQNRFRVLSEPIMGYEWWEESSEGRKPFRVKSFQEAVENGTEPIKHFWAFVVWNYKSESIQVLEITQKTIMRSLEGLAIDEDWGDPTNYDVVINRTGDGLETEYTIQPKPSKDVSKDVLKAYEDSEIDLSALFRGEYPMSKENNENEVNSEEVADSIPF